MAKKNDPLALDAQLCFALYASSLAMTQVYKPLLEPLGLTYLQYIVMLVLWEQDGIQLKELANRLQQKPGALTPVIKRLEAQGLLKRVRSLEDERAIAITLTDTGRKLKKQAANVNKCVFNSCGIEASELDSIRLELQELNRTLRNSL